MVVAFSSKNIKAQTCTGSNIQAKLDSGKSVLTVMNECLGTDLSNFYGKTMGVV